MDPIRATWLGLALFLLGIVGVFVAPLLLPWPNQLSWAESRRTQQRREQRLAVALFLVAVCGLALAVWGIVQ